MISLIDNDNHYQFKIHMIRLYRKDVAMEHLMAKRSAKELEYEKNHLATLTKAAK